MKPFTLFLVMLIVLPNFSQAQFYKSDCTRVYARNIEARYMRREAGSESWVVNLYNTCTNLIRRSGVGEPGWYAAVGVLERHAQAISSGHDNRSPVNSSGSSGSIGSGGGSSGGLPPACPNGGTMILGICH